MNSIPTIDMNLALQQAGGSRELADELFSMLLRELPTFERGMRSAYDRDDLNTLQRTVHKLHGAATYCGVPALKQAAAELESALKKSETGQLQSQLDGVLAEVHKVQAHAHERLPPGH